MTRYRKIPVEVEAVPIRDVVRLMAEDWKALPEWVVAAYEKGDLIPTPKEIYIRTLEGEMTGGLDDYLIQGVHGELYPCKGEIFAKTYSPLTYSEPPEREAETD